EGILYLNPQNNAMRSECSQMLSNFLYIEPVYEINGNDLSLYTIVYPANTVESVEEGALKLSKYIEKSIGIKLPVVSDETKTGEYEILVGKTNREDSDIVKVDRSSFTSDNAFEVTAQGNYLVVAGVDSDKHDSRYAKELDGSFTAVHYLLEEKFGVEFYIQDEEETGCEDLIKYSPDPVISFDNGYRYTDEPFFNYRVFYMSGSILGKGQEKGNLSQNISNYLTGNIGSYENNYNATPCLTDKTNKEKITDTILRCIEESDYSKLCLAINDSSEYCKCTDCNALYRTHKSRCGPIITLTNEVAAKVKALYPGFEIQFGAYTYTSTPPVGIELVDNISIEYITIEGCAGHAYNDPDCAQNVTMMEEMTGWYELTGGKLHFWDHSGAFVKFITPFPDWDSTLTNVRIFADYSFEESGILINSVFGGKHPDFGKIRAYMFDLMYRDPYMSEEEYNYHLNKGLEAYYGAGWKYLKAYTEIIAQMGNEKCHKFHAPASGYYNFETVDSRVDEIDALWEKAENNANSLQLERLTLAKQSWIYLKQSATYNSRYVNGTNQQRSEYVAINEALYNYVTENDVIWTEAVHGSLVNVDFTKSPDTWQIG
ncbi:MAG: DUF4838 domain-containing protein, partial [Clostridia bacterium]|nr:DUF4838 domain-containing protein [Clostridia bacterium]